MLLCYAMNATGTDIFRAFKTGTSTLGLNGQTIATFNVAKGASVNSNGDFKTGVSVLQNNAVGGTFGLTVSGTNGASSFNLPGQPLKVDITGSGASGRNAIDLRGSSDNDAVGIIQNKPKFFLFDYSANNGAGDRASLEAKNGDFSGNLRVGGGSPTAGSVLMSTDAAGNAAWSATSSVQAKLLDAGDMKIYRTSWYNNNNTIIHEGYATCDPGYMAISGGVDCEPSGDGATHSVQISEPAKNYNSSYGYTGSGSGNGTSSTEYPKAWRGKCGATNSNSSLDFHITVVCMKVNATSSNLLTGVTPQSSGGTSGGSGGSSSGGTTLTWTAPSGAGNCSNSAFGCAGTLGQSCNTWLASTTHAATKVEGTYNINGNVAVTTTPATGTCAYKHVNPVSKDPAISINGITSWYSSCQIHPSGYSDTNAFPVTDCSHGNATLNGSTGKSVIIRTRIGN
jgi:hypothetical protein